MSVVSTQEVWLTQWTDGQLYCSSFISSIHSLVELIVCKLNLWVHAYEIVLC